MLDSWIGPSDIEHRPVLLFQWQDDNGAWPYDVYRSRGDEFGDWKVLRSMSATQRVNMQAGCNRAAAMLQSYRPYAPGRTTLLDTTEVGSAVCDCQHDSRTPGQINITTKRDVTTMSSPQPRLMRTLPRLIRHHAWQTPRLVETKKTVLKGKTRVQIAKMSKENLASKHAEAKARERAARDKAAAKAEAAKTAKQAKKQEKEEAKLRKEVAKGEAAKQKLRQIASPQIWGPRGYLRKSIQSSGRSE